MLRPIGGARTRARIGTIDYEHEHRFTEHEQGCRFAGKGDWRGVSKQMILYLGPSNYCVFRPIELLRTLYPASQTLRPIRDCCGFRTKVVLAESNPLKLTEHSRQPKGVGNTCLTPRMAEWGINIKAQGRAQRRPGLPWTYSFSHVFIVGPLSPIAIVFLQRLSGPRSPPL